MSFSHLWEMCGACHKWQRSEETGGTGLLFILCLTTKRMGVMFWFCVYVFWMPSVVFNTTEGKMSITSYFRHLANKIQIERHSDQRWEERFFSSPQCSLLLSMANQKWRLEQGSCVKILVCLKVSIHFSSFVLWLIFTDWENEWRWKINSVC